MILLCKLHLVDLVFQPCFLLYQLYGSLALYLEVLLDFERFVALIAAGLGCVLAVLLYDSFVLLAHHVWQAVESLGVLKGLPVLHGGLNHCSHLFFQPLVFVEYDLQAIEARPLRALATFLGSMLAAPVVVLWSDVAISFEGLVEHVDLILVSAQVV